MFRHLINAEVLVRNTELANADDTRPKLKFAPQVGLKPPLVHIVVGHVPWCQKLRRQGSLDYLLQIASGIKDRDSDRPIYALPDQRLPTAWQVARIVVVAIIRLDLKQLVLGVWRHRVLLVLSLTLISRAQRYGNRLLRAISRLRYRNRSGSFARLLEITFQ